MKKDAFLLAVFTMTLESCVVIPGPEHETLGIVSGVWRHDELENRIRLNKDKQLLTEEDINKLSNRYIVKVMERDGYFAQYVVLPEGWSYSLEDVVDDGHTVNVGDTVIFRAATPRAVDYLISIKSKCNAPTIADELRKSQFGCVKIKEFKNKSGYAGTS